MSILPIHKLEQMFYSIITHKIHWQMYRIVDNCQKMVYYVGRFINVRVCVVEGKRWILKVLKLLVL